jgi:hypothetical protein
MKTLLALAAAAVAFTAAPADAKHYVKHHKAMVCTKWRHGTCIASHSVDRHSALYRVGYRFAPRYAYTPFNTLPRAYVTRYSLAPDYRYVYRDNYIYVVNPRTYAVERVISALTR